ncbi:GNAT family N-acetyltransferase [Dubosiella newyorkensis]|uniref:GNAT family N-acetyltransferase n=1 Tax=Dubosiella newyorkensis TaxID=1862672 RepID=UPI002572F00A|nr:GNAT family N-acetyltransferase [Dubosiella newyorkensis]
MRIRNAKSTDLEQLEQLYENARNYMHTYGNPNQWNDGHPNQKDLKEDILKEQLYIVESVDGIEGAFVYYEGIDPTYIKIEGEWLNEEPYAVLHKVASAGKKKRIGDTILQYGIHRSNNVKIDTHADNIPMQKCILRNGFQYAGIIYLANGDPRNAYQFSRLEKR